MPESRIEVPQLLYRRLGSRVFALFMHLTLGLWHVRDTQCGFKFFPGRCRATLFAQQRIDGYMFDIELLLLARAQGYRVKEVGVRWRDDGDSRLDLVAGNARNLADVLRIRFGRYRRRRRPRSPADRPMRPSAGTSAPRNLEEVACNLCGGTATRAVHPQGRLRPGACTSCGLVYVNPRTRCPGLTAHYNSDESSRIEYYSDAEVADRRTFVEILASRANDCSAAPETCWTSGPERGTCWCRRVKRGCAVARRRDERGGGAPCAARCGGSTCVTERLETRRIRPTASTPSSMGDVIEHVPDPQAALAPVAPSLSPGGALLISTPDVAALGRAPASGEAGGAHLLFLRRDALGAARAGGPGRRSRCARLTATGT